MTARAESEAAKPFTVTVHGLPVTKGSLTPIIVGGPQCPACGGKTNARATVMQGKTGQARQRLKNWRLILRTIIQAAWNAEGRGMIGIQRGSYPKPISVSMRFYLQRPKSAPSYQTRPTKKPDIDKLARVVLDELVAAGVCKDDTQPVSVHMQKVYAEPGMDTGVTITVAEIEE